jgi:hypothetical protein
MKYQIKSYNTATSAVNVAICGDTDDLSEAKQWGVSLLFLNDTQAFETQISDLWTMYQLELRARENLNTDVVSYILDNTGVTVELADPPQAQSSHSTAVDSTGTTGVEVL